MINWGILGLGRMGRTFANAIKETSNSRLISIASKSENVFDNFKNDTYENVINNKEIDAIYISSLNNTHVDLIKKTIQKKKFVLCEKPISTTFKDLNSIVTLYDKKKNYIYEAIAYYCHPQTLEIINLIKNNEIGEIKTIECNFGFKAKVKSSSRLFNKSLGGGAIFDLGCYPISFFMLFCKDTKKIVFEEKNLNYAKTGVDDDATATLNYDNKFTGKIHVSLKDNLKNICNIYGTKGYLKVNQPWLPNKESFIEVMSDNHFYLKTVNSGLSVYANQIEKVSNQFSNSNYDNKFNLFDIEKSLNNMRLIEEWLKN